MKQHFLFSTPKHPATKLAALTLLIDQALSELTEPTVEDHDTVINIPARTLLIVACVLMGAGLLGLLLQCVVNCCQKIGNKNKNDYQQIP